MKRIIAFIVLLAGISNFIHAQAAKPAEEESNCYLKWAKKFEERGAEDVSDGTYSDVVVTYRRAGDADCYNGKCEVKDGKITAMYTKMEDGTYSLVKKKLKYEIPVTIVNGISATLLTVDNEMINVLFIKKIKPKKAGFERAAEPTDD